MAKLRLGACERHDFLPLLWSFLKGNHAEVVKLELYPEARLMPLLESRDLDVALVSPVEALARPGIELIRDLCIAARSAAPSTRLVSPLEPGDEIDSAGGCLAAQWAADQVTRRLAEGGGPGRDPVRRRVVLVGDFRETESADNLAGHWERGFGGSLVLAVWAARLGALENSTEYYLKSGLRYAMTAIDSLVSEVAAATGVPREGVARAYREDYSYFIAESERVGLAAIRQQIGHAADRQQALIGSTE